MLDQTIQEQVIARVGKDVTFRQELLGNPRTVLARDHHDHIAEHAHSCSACYSGDRKDWASARHTLPSNPERSGSTELFFSGSLAWVTAGGEAVTLTVTLP